MKTRCDQASEEKHKNYQNRAGSKLTKQETLRAAKLRVQQQ